MLAVNRGPIRLHHQSQIRDVKLCRKKGSQTLTRFGKYPQRSGRRRVREMVEGAAPAVLLPCSLQDRVPVWGPGGRGAAGLGSLQHRPRRSQASVSARSACTKRRAPLGTVRPLPGAICAHCQACTHVRTRGFREPTLQTLLATHGGRIARIGGPERPWSPSSSRQ